ncbi:MAG: YeeE/YedE thiosulfate transporter family protein [Cytophagales bacterium]|nr:YeeE/YedE thiosulfate transporter family protein [Cytophagales bacterium]
MIEVIRQPWAWYVGGALIGLTVPALLLMGNKHFGISSSLRHICAACLPGDIAFFQYDWKKEIWNLFFVAGVLLGAILASQLLWSPEGVKIADSTVRDLQALGIQVDNELLPASIFSFEHLMTLKGFVFIVVGGFLVGFGTRYAGGCTSGHSIMGLSNLQMSSLIATACFMIGGFTMVHLIFPWLFKLID